MSEMRSTAHGCSACSADHSHDHGHDYSHSHDHGDFNLRAVLIPFAIAFVLFLVGLIFHDFLHGTPFAIAEYAILIPAYLISGWSVLTTAGRNILRGQVFDENFLMTIATLGAISIHELPEAVAVMLFFQIGEMFQGFAVGRSRRSIKSLLEVRPDIAHLKINGEAKTVSPETIEVGDIILVKPGGKDSPGRRSPEWQVPGGHLSLNRGIDTAHRSHRRSGSGGHD